MFKYLVKYFAGKKESDPPILKTTKIGDWYLYPTTAGVALIVQVLGITPKAIIISTGKSRVYTEHIHWNELAAPLPKIRILDSIEDTDNSLVFVRYRNNSTWLDRLYNRYVGDRTDGSVLNDLVVEVPPAEKKTVGQE